MTGIKVVDLLLLMPRVEKLASSVVLVLEKLLS